MFRAILICWARIPALLTRVRGCLALIGTDRTDPNHTALLCPHSRFAPSVAGRGDKRQPSRQSSRKLPVAGNQASAGAAGCPIASSVSLL
ncbi:hypothetical protein PR003_g11343 [Phytophthora rubi]|uniref:Secreted protein n=1 Tax=Phytophthora rubi TaxID=129364 RepID=A0A6A3M1L6_9STRA|nr:hypothetical protein PR001_g12446 [Phytophthora rubi]KAE9338745.1 hypothetical protein PR003_g11343 [Phytophthora rubi]